MIKDKVRVSVRDRVGVRVSDGNRVSTFYFCHISSPHFTRIQHKQRCSNNCILTTLVILVVKKTNYYNIATLVTLIIYLFIYNFVRIPEVKKRRVN